jgi:hypothetical protein
MASMDSGAGSKANPSQITSIGGKTIFRKLFLV